MAASVRATSITAKKSIEVTGMCSDGCCEVEDGPAVLGGAGAIGDETGGDAGTCYSSLGRSSA